MRQSAAKGVRRDLRRAMGADAIDLLDRHGLALTECRSRLAAHDELLKLHDLNDAIHGRELRQLAEDVVTLRIRTRVPDTLWGRIKALVHG